MYWALVMVSLWSPVHGIEVMDFGAYETHEECIYNMRDLEVHMTEHEGAMCLLVDGVTNKWEREFDWFKSD